MAFFGYARRLAVKVAFRPTCCAIRRVDLVLSGVNHGSNSAVNVLYSRGTMGAAIEGSFYGLSVDRAVASRTTAPNADFEEAELYAERIRARGAANVRWGSPACA